MAIAWRLHRAVALALMITCWQPGLTAKTSEQKTELIGTWKLVILAFGEDEFAIIDVTENEGRPSASVAVSQRGVLGDAVVESLAISGDSLEIELRGLAGASKFQGTLAHSGSQEGRIPGTFLFRGEVFPARLERTKDHRIAGLHQSEIAQDYATAKGEPNPKLKLQKLRDSIKKHEDEASCYLLYGELLASAEAGGLEASEVDAAIKAWLEGARPYGPTWISESRLRALRALRTAHTYAKLTLALAEQADKEIDEEQSLGKKAEVVSILGRAARLAGDADVARTAEARSARLEDRLDAEYHKRVPPFAPQKFAGRKDAKDDRVVLMELFTGAQCPPCVAADVAFDALLETYQPSEFIALQYHVHIPGPDPLTNNDTLRRLEYYGDEIGGTPATLFNGHLQAPGGGAMQQSEQKYKQFRQVIETDMQGTRGATIDLTATCSGDEIKIKVSASLRVTAAAGQSRAAQPKESGGTSSSTKPAQSGPRARLRLVLTEPSVRYLGTNRLRLHHHVVRGFPGGVDGKALSSGSADLAVTVKLADLRRQLEEYVSEFSKKRPFPGVIPDIALKDLAIVAFVQDDDDKSILHAVTIPVK